jgi:hypothetical protein
MVDKLAGIGSQYAGSLQVYNWNLGLWGWEESQWLADWLVGVYALNMMTD